jgi:hypothetical protein
MVLTLQTATLPHLDQRLQTQPQPQTQTQIQTQIRQPTAIQQIVKLQ